MKWKRDGHIAKEISELHLFSTLSSLIMCFVFLLPRSFEHLLILMRIRVVRKSFKLKKLIYDGLKIYLETKSLFKLRIEIFFNYEFEVFRKVQI